MRKRKSYTQRENSPSRFLGLEARQDKQRSQPFVLKNAFKEGSPLLCFVATYTVLSMVMERLKDWRNSSTRCAELFPGKYGPLLCLTRSYWSTEIPIYLRLSPGLYKSCLRERPFHCVRRGPQRNANYGPTKLFENIL